MRQIIAHLHLFKNAGTSVEHGLHEAFGKRWLSYDRPTGNKHIFARDLAVLLKNHPRAVAVSSHQLHPPFTAVEGFAFDPLVFVRHPIDRIRSAYDFERRQGSITPSSEVAADRSLAGWIGYHNERGSLQCENFQVMSLTTLRSPGGGPLRRLHPAPRHLRSAQEFLSSVPVVGIVERYERSCDLMSEWLASKHPGFRLRPAHANPSGVRTNSLEERLGQVEAMLGNHGYQALLEANQADLELWSWASRRLPR